LRKFYNNDIRMVLMALAAVDLVEVPTREALTREAIREVLLAKVLVENAMNLNVSLATMNKVPAQNNLSAP
jgi:hypothetical protein